MTTLAPATTMPAAVRSQVTALRKAVRRAVPARTASNLLVGSWNLRALAGLTDSWDAPESASPKRDWRAAALIAAVISAFDVVAVQEVRRDTTGLRAVLAELGPDWQFLCSDVTEGDAGNGERLTFVYDTTRVRPSGLVGEVVLPPVAGRAAKQFARSPYAVSFTRADVEFILTTVHIVWDGAPAKRVPEIAAFATWMHDWAVRQGDWNGNLLALGDFNLEGPGHRSTGRSSPPVSSRPVSSAACRARSSTTPTTRTTTTRSPGSPTSPRTEPCTTCCTAWSSPATPGTSTSCRTSTRVSRRRRCPGGSATTTRSGSNSRSRPEVYSPDVSGLPSESSAVRSPESRSASTVRTPARGPAPSVRQTSGSSRR